MTATRWPGARAFVLAVLVPIGWSAQVFADEAASQVALWHGPWYLGMTSGIADLKLGGDGGTLTLTNNEHFGGDPVAVRDLELQAGQLSFRALGADGKLLTCQMPVSSDGARARGFCRYAGFNVRFELNRIPDPSAAR